MQQQRARASRKYMDSYTMMWVHMQQAMPTL